MNWLKSGRRDRFRYVLVEWPTFKEQGQLSGIKACKITDNSLSSLKSSGSLEYAGTLDTGENLVRVYSDSTLEGETETLCHGTFFVTTPSSTWSGIAHAGSADMYSVLWLLQQNKVEEAYTVLPNTEVVTLAASLARGYGNNLQVVATPSKKRVTTTHTWDAGTTYLEIINWLLDFAGYNSADVDAYGNVVMTPYVKPANKAAVATFSDVWETVSEPGFDYEFDAFEVPNKVICICSNSDNEPLVAKAINDDPENPYSTVSRKKTLVQVETVSDIADAETLQAKAENLLITSMSVVESIEISHSYQPFNMGDAIQIHYVQAGHQKKMIAVSREKQMVPGMRCKTRVRRFVNL